MIFSQQKSYKLIYNILDTSAMKIVALIFLGLRVHVTLRSR